MTVTIFKDANANAIFIEDSNGVQFVNSLSASMDDPTSTNLEIIDLAREIYLFKDVPHDFFVDASGASYGATPTLACNALNTVFASAGSSTGVAPTITSATTVNMTAGDTLNYELTATLGVGYEWSNLPSGVLTVEGNVRKLVGGSSLTSGTYTISATAVNYFGQTSATISLVVSSPTHSNTKSVDFGGTKYLSATASLLDATLGRSGNGSGSSDAWSISTWFKPSTDTSGQVLFYYGASDTTNGGHIELRYVGNGDKLRVRYGSTQNYLQLQTSDNALTHSVWNHVLLTYDGGTTGSSSGDISSYYSRFKLYIDGVLVSTNNSQNNYGWSAAVSGQNLRVGRYSSGQYLKAVSRVDELSIWNSDQASNVADIYNSGATHDLSNLTTPPTHWWRMGDGDTYPTLQDNMGSADFTMYNMTSADIVTDAP